MNCLHLREQETDEVGFHSNVFLLFPTITNEWRLNMLKKFFFFVLITVVLIGCSTMHSSEYSSPLEVKLISPLKADVEVSGIITGEASMVNLLIFFNIGQPNEFAEGISYGTENSRSAFFNLIPYEDLKAAAAYDAVNKSKADVIVAPKYIIKTDNYLLFKTVNVKVTGYKGIIKGIKN